jgi:hypothetical protein
MPKFGRSAILAAVAFLALGMSGRAPALAASFDGDWSVVIITEAGDCDRAYRYPVRVVNGAIKYEGEAGITISGRVGPDGKLNASVQRGEQRADGSGRLSQTSGTGKWSGKSRTSQCSGRWEAEKREG